VSPIGTLYIVATPIGNLEDITLRALRVLKEVDLIAAEDTRRTRKLLSHYQIKTPMVSYHAHNQAVRGPDLIEKMRQGQTIALVGQTGAGKTSIANLIARFYDVTKGRILIDGNDLLSIEKTSYRRQLGLVLQDPFLFSGTVKNNIRYGNLEATDEQVIAAAKTVGAHEFITKMEKGYDTELQERGQNLSMGQRQIISLAEALMTTASAKSTRPTSINAEM
jgi:ATP-binding cassette subfamily B multidrug efflux pump